MSHLRHHSEAPVGHVDHNILRHLRIERDSEEYKRFENPNPLGLAEKLRKNIEDLHTMPAEHEVKAPPNLEEKANIREKMFSFLDESRMEETRLVRSVYDLAFVAVASLVLSPLTSHVDNSQELEYDQAKAHGDVKLAEEIAEALFILQKSNCENLSDIISSYKPSAFSKVWGNDAEYQDMVKQFGAGLEDVSLEDSAAPKVGKARKNRRADK
jgi:hypothetical protein